MTHEYVGSPVGQMSQKVMGQEKDGETREAVWLLSYIIYMLSLLFI